MAALLLVLLPLAGAARADPREIEYLITFVANSGCDFDRNDSVHDSMSAAEHLRSKYHRGKRWVNSAEQFIERIASSSSISGKPYQAVCDSERISSRDWLYRALAAHREAVPDQ